ncbi:MAG: DUF721 domain-containing protein [Bacteroidota bacterium]|jgi:hypothetical protein
MKNTNTFSLKEALAEWIERSPLKQRITESKIIEAYQEAMGPVLFKKTRVIRVEGRTLHLKFDSAPLRAEVFNSRSELLQTINEKFVEPAIDEIHLG